MLDQYDPDRGRLPALVRSYTEQDGLQPYVDSGARDPRLWVQLGLASDHADYLKTIAAVAHAHPASRTTTELLFLLDKIARLKACATGSLG